MRLPIDALASLARLQHTEAPNTESVAEVRFPPPSHAPTMFQPPALVPSIER